MDFKSADDTSGGVYASLYAKILDNSGNAIRTIKSIDIMIGDTIYSYNSMMEMKSGSSTVILDSAAVDFIKALSTAGTITIRLGTDRGSTTHELDWNETNSSLKKYASTLVNTGAIDYLNYDDGSTYALLANIYTITVR